MYGCLKYALFLLFLFGGIVPLRAQDEPVPSVEIDTSVLNELNRHYGVPDEETPHPLTLTPPAPVRPSAPSLTATPAEKKVESPPVQTPVQARVPAKAQSFPVQTRVRSESINPASLATPQQKDVPAAVAVPLPPRKPPIASPMPDMVTEAVRDVMRDEVDDTDILTPEPFIATPVPPKPKRRPDSFKVSRTYARNVQKESLSKEAAAAKPKPPVVVRQDKVTADVPKMPAVPKDLVNKEPLTKKLVNPSREQLLASVEQIAEQTGEVSEIVMEPSPEDLLDFEQVVIFFAPDVAQLDDKAQETIKKMIIPLLQNNAAARVQVMAYSAPSDSFSSGARRTSLSRALEIRAFLLKNGISTRRVDIRALGDETDQMPQDRAELVLIPGA
ncbi:MAG: OmpA family protein [Rhodospirillales bacterium]|nr:OmpA family protein [Rhodospirillales bacterium]